MKTLETILMVVCMAAFLFGGQALSVYMQVNALKKSHDDAEKELQIEAVAHGFARWAATTNGETSFEWLQPEKTK